MNGIFKIIDRLNNEYLSFWEDFCNIESPTDYKEGVDKAGEYVIEKAKALGFDIEVCKQSVSGNAVCITMNKNCNLPFVCLSGHMDTVHPVGSFGTPAVKTDQEYIYGPGTTDCKGGIVAALMAMHALSLSGYGNKTVKLILQSDEETSSKGSNKETVKFMAEKAKGCVAFINCEGARDGGMVIERKGILRYKFTVKGKAAHASAATSGVSAIAEAARKITELEGFKDDNGITANCGTVSGGTADNVVPEECVFTVDFRFRNSQQCGFIKEKVKEIAGKAFIVGTSCAAELLSERPAMEINEVNTALYHKINTVLENNGMEKMGTCFSGGGSDASDMTAYGIPTVDGFGVRGAFIHSLEEKAEIKSLAYSAKRLAAVIVQI